LSSDTDVLVEDEEELLISPPISPLRKEVAAAVEPPEMTLSKGEKMAFFLVKNEKKKKGDRIYYQPRQIYGALSINSQTTRGVCTRGSGLGPKPSTELEEACKHHSWIWRCRRRKHRRASAIGLMGRESPTHLRKA
jgi:hypothetical protein